MKAKAFIFLLSLLFNLNIWANSAGKILVLSKNLVSDSAGELILSYQVGEAGFNAGDELWIQLPAVWYNNAGCPRVDRIINFQSKDPNKDGYFGIKSAPLGTKFSLRKINRKDIYGDSNRFVQVLIFHLDEGRLAFGQKLILCFRHLVKNGTPWLPKVLASGPILAQLKKGNEVLWIPAQEIKMSAGAPCYLLISLPSVIYEGEKASAKIRLLDKNYNLVKNWKYPVKLIASSGCEVEPIQVLPDENGVGRAKVSFEKNIFWLEGFYPQIPPAKSNPALVMKKGSFRVFWGDVHSHSQFSHDGVGVKPFEYARFASALDFYALTEHLRAISEREWEQIQRWVSEFYQPGEFVTILAYENSTLHPSGHHNVYFSGEKAPHPITNSLSETWDKLKDYNPLLIQHHLGIGWVIDLPSWAVPIMRVFNRAFGPQVNWTKYKDVPRPSLEIYSAHGQSEYYNPDDALSYEHCDLILPEPEKIGFCNTGYSQQGAHYARDAWAQGLKLGVVAGSDDHRAQPGRIGAGLTAVLAKNLTRKDIISAIRARRTYATTGDRIYLDFRINGKVMGSELKISHQTKPKIYLKVVGTDEISYIQVLSYDFINSSWREVKKINPRGFQYEESFVDSRFSGRAMYYLRVEQKNKRFSRPVRAWSSPIWVEAD